MRWGDLKKEQRRGRLNSKMTMNLIFLDSGAKRMLKNASTSGSRKNTRKNKLDSSLRSTTLNRKKQHSKTPSTHSTRPSGRRTAP